MNMSFKKHISKKSVIITIESKSSVIDCVHIIILQSMLTEFSQGNSEQINVRRFYTILCRAEYQICL